MSVLVAYSGTHSSAELAEQIADRLLKAGIAATVRPVNQITNIQRYQAVVLGSALHDCEWLPEAAGFMRNFWELLACLPVWLFSVGEFDSTPRKLPATAFLREGEAAHVQHANCIRGHRYFANTSTPGERSQLRDLVLKICGGSPDDRHDWREVNEWAEGIARHLQAIDHKRERRRLHLSVRGRP